MPNTIPAAGEAMPAAHTEPTPTLCNLRDEWGRLDSRIRVYAAAAERLANDYDVAGRLAEGGSLLRGTDDLLDFADEFREMFDTFLEGAKNERREVIS